MTKLGHIQKLNILLEENERNIARSKTACEHAQIDTSFTMSDAIHLFVHGNNLHDVSGERAEFHDAMHIAAQAKPNAHGEAIAAIFEQTLLREPYNGDLNHQLAEAAKQPRPIRHMIIARRKFNPSGQEDFEVPAPVASFESAKALAQERFDFTSKAPGKTLPEEEAMETYERAVETDRFFTELMGGRAPYQLHLKELLDTPIAFFGLQQIEQDNELIIESISAEVREEILNNLGDQNIVLHHIDSARTEAELSRIYQPEHLQGSEHLEL